MSDELIGQNIGQYQIRMVLGKGGMSTVYQAYQPSMDRIVAIKLLPRAFMHDDTFLKRFQQETKTVARLEHPHVLPVYDTGEFEGLPYIVMRYVSGGTLAQLIDTRLPDLDLVVRVARQIGDALDYAHGYDVIHRDMKPSNILLDEHGNTYLSDFGIARVAQNQANLTGSRVIGTPPYIAPEMVRSDDRVTGSADQYGLGIIAFEMLTGRPPYRDENPMKVLMAHVLDPVPSIRDINANIDSGIERVLQKVLAKTAAERYPNCRAFAQDLERAVRKVQEGPATQIPRRSSSMETQPRQVVQSPQPMKRTSPSNPSPSPRVQRPARMNSPQPMNRPDVIGTGQVEVSPARGVRRPKRSGLGSSGTSCLVTLIAIGAIAVGVLLFVFILTDGNPGELISSFQRLTSSPSGPVGPVPTELLEDAPAEDGAPQATAMALDTPDVVLPAPGGGNRIAFASNRDGDFEIYLIDVNGSNLVQLTDNTGQDFDPTWSPNGGQIAYAFRPDDTADSEILVMNADGSEVTPITDNGAADFDPDWSHDGEWIAFTSNRSGVFDLYIMRPDGSDVCQLTNDGLNSLTPRWSPSGNRIGYHARTANNRETSELYLIEVDTSNPCQEVVQSEPFQLTSNNARDQWLDWSPDGQDVIYTSGQGRPVGEQIIYRFNLEANETVAITDAAANDDDPVWSPDGSLIAFDSDRDGNRFFDLYILDVASGEISQLTTDEADDVAPAWQPRPPQP